MIDSYLNQSATLKRPTAMTAGGEQTFSTEFIKCRFEHHHRLIVNAKGEQVVSEARIFTRTEVRIGDVIAYNGRDWPVMQIAEQYALAGVSHYEVWL